MIASVIGAFYYLRIVKVMYVDAEGEGLDPRMPALNSAALAGAALLLLRLADDWHRQTAWGRWPGPTLK